MSIQYKVEENLLTTPPSYSVRFVARGSAGREDIAADIALRHPNFSKADILTILNAEDEAVMGRLLDGEQVTKEGCCSWFPSFTGKLDSPDDPLPPLDQCLHLNVRVSPPFVEDFSKDAQVERLPATEKLPVITGAEDTVLGLRDVLRADGMLRITGSNLAFDRQDSGQRCLIEGTRSGSAVQSRVGTVSNSEIVLMPDLPAQPDPWNNEFQLSVTVRYTERGSLRTGVYKRRLRSPLTVSGMWEATPPLTGILTGSETSPHVHVTGGSVAAAETLRIQAVFDSRADALLFSLLDMSEGGKAGAAVTVTADGAVALPGFAGSAVSSLNFWVNNYAGLKEMIRSGYGGRVADILQVQTA
jgi:hypothetical protein